MAKCYDGCTYHRDLVGSAHSKCVLDWHAAGIEPPRFQAHGIKNGWVIFPYNFDPVWMIGDCPGHARETDPNLVRERGDAFEELIGLLGPRIVRSGG